MHATHFRSFAVRAAAWLLAAMTVIATAGRSPSVSAQAYTGDFIVAGSWYLTGDAIARVSRTNGAATTFVPSISQVQQAHHADIIQAEDNASFYVLSEAERVVCRFDKNGGSLVTVFDGRAILTGPRDLLMDDRGDLIITDDAGVFRLELATLKVTTLLKPASVGAVLATTQNIDDGKFLVGGVGGLVQLDQLSGTTTSLIGLPGSSGFRYHMAQEPALGRLYAGTCCGTGNGQVMLRFDLQNLESTIVVGAHPVARAAYAHRFDRRVRTAGDHMIYSSVSGFAIPGNASGLFAFDEAGNVTSLTVYGTPALGVLTSWGLEIEGSRNVACLRTGPVNDREIRLSFPDQPGRPYLIALGLSGVRPGVPLGDGRQIHLRPDAAMFLSLAGGIPGVWNPGPGVLDPQGRALAALRLTAFGRGLRGVPIWVSALVIDPAAPKGVAAIAETVVVLLE